MFVFCMVLGLFLGAAEGPWPESEGIGRRDGGDSGGTSHGSFARVAVRSDSGAYRGGERIGLLGLEFGHTWRGHPDSTSAWSVGARTPRIVAGFHAEASFRRSLPVAARRTARTVRRAAPAPRDRWRAGLSGAWLAGWISWRNPRPALTGWSGRVGSRSGRAGQWNVSRTLGTNPATAFAWRRGGPERVEISGRLRRYDGRLRVVNQGPGGSAELRLSSTRARKASRGGRRPAVPSIGRVRLRVSRAGWGMALAVAVRKDSAAAEGTLSRGLKLPGGHARALTGIRVGPAPLGRAHLSYTPRLHLGPVGFEAGAGVVVRESSGRAVVRPEISASAGLRRGAVSARLGWVMNLESGYTRITPGVAGNLEARPGPLVLQARIRPGKGGLRWALQIAWRK